MCRVCNTETEKRRILFGSAGYIEIVCCECEASRLALKYSGTKEAQDVHKV